ncbi:MAG: hypothetical protein IT436_12490 [Phycisphaerales bacterium]|nr:hypothetical protein [Phycisphaerales bacterium]
MPARRGLTLMETVLAAALLGLVAAGVFSAISSMAASQDRQLQRLGAAELCNRLLLQYLDDKEAMPDPTAPLAYADRRFRWSIKEEPVKLKLPAARAAQASTGPQRTLPLDRLKLITVNVWLSEDSGGERNPGGLTPQFAITRLIDPFNFARNPDSAENMVSTEAGMRRLMEQFIGAGGQVPERLLGGPGAGRPGPGGGPGQRGQPGQRPPPREGITPDRRAPQRTPGGGQ